MADPATLTILAVAAGTKAYAGVREAQAMRSAASQEEEAARIRSEELRFQAQQEQTAGAISRADREKMLRRSLAAQNAAFATTGALALNSGTQQTLGNQDIGLINREQRLGLLNTGLVQNNLRMQASQELAAGRNRGAALRFGATTSLIRTGADLASMASSASNVARSGGQTGTFMDGAQTTQGPGQKIYWNS